MNRFAELLDRLVLTPSRNAKLKLLADYFAATPDPDRGFALAAIAGGLSFATVKPGVLRALARRAHGPGAVCLFLRLCRRPRRDAVAGLARAGGRCGGRRPGAFRRRRHAVACQPLRRAGRGCRPARPARRAGPLRAHQAGHRRPAHRRVGHGWPSRRWPPSARSMRPRSRSCGTGWSRPMSRCSPGWRAAPDKPENAAPGAVPAGHAGPCRRRRRSRKARPGRLCGRVEMGRHPRAGHPRGRRGAALFAHRRRHFRRLSRPRRGDGFRRRRSTASCWSATRPWPPAPSTTCSSG